MAKIYPLNTDAKHFARWLAYHVHDNRGPVAETRDGSLFLEGTYAGELSDGIIRVTIYGSRHFYTPEGEPPQPILFWDLVTVDVVPLSEKELELCAYTHEPLAGEYFQYLLREIRKHWPEARLYNGEPDASQAPPEPLPLPRPQRKGGRSPTSWQEMEDKVRGWWAARGRMTQEQYCRTQGIRPSTLRHWMRELEAREAHSTPAEPDHSEHPAS